VRVVGAAALQPLQPGARKRLSAAAGETEQRRIRNIVSLKAVAAR